MKSIILIQPRAGTLEMLGTRIPYGLLSVAALPHQAGYKVIIIDQRLDKEWEKTLLLHLKEKPICVGITCMTGEQIKYALRASEVVKKNSDTLVVWGGIHPTLLPEQTLENEFIDIIVTREGDITFFELVNALQNKTSLKKIKGILYKEQGKISKTQDREFIKNLDSLPEIPYELVDINKYASLDLGEHGKSLDFITSRGCPYKCAFCYNYIFNKQKWRAFSAEETVRRLKKLVKTYNIKTIYFQDDNFCADLDRFKKIISGIIKEKLNIKWGTLGLRVDTAKRMDDKLIDLMVESGCRNVDIGAESGSQEILDRIDKQIRVEDILAINRRLAKYPFIIKYTFIIGFPEETEEQRKQTIDLALKLCKENKNAYTPFGIYTPYPGTTFYHVAIEHGFQAPKKLEEWANFNIDSWALFFKSWLSERERKTLSSMAFTSLFANKAIIYKINKPLTKLLFYLYSPIGEFRFKHNFHSFPIESRLAKLL